MQRAETKPYGRTEFRAELKKRMPGYDWTIAAPNMFHRKDEPECLTATGTQSSGSNRTSTLIVDRFVDGTFRARIWNGSPRSDHFVASTSATDRYANGRRTLAQCLRALQEMCDWTGRRFLSAASTIADARIATGESSEVQS